MSWYHAARARARLLFARDAAESRMDEEIRFHVEMETARLVREQGLDPAEARRRSLVAFGGVERHKEDLRDGRGLAWLGGLSLDLRLGARMLVKYPGLTVVGGLAMAFALWVGAVTFEILTLALFPSLPLPAGDRVVRLQNWDVRANASEPRALHDFLVWRESLRSITDLGAFRDVSRNLIGPDGDSRPVALAEITASGFRIDPTPPLLGRTLVAADERAGAPPVVVLGYDVWRTRFAGDPRVVGRTVQLGETFATVVGVMPEGFAFPVAHEAWTPLRAEAYAPTPRAGPAITVFGRLAPGATLASAGAELGTGGRPAAAAPAETHQHLEPRVTPYAELFSAPTGTDLGFLLLIELFTVMLVVLVCGNVALLLFARAATRESEIVVRSALGASRRRIVVQLFAEALVLGGFAAAVGLPAAGLALRAWGVEFLERNIGRLPFWYDPHLSAATVLYACALTVLGAIITGVLPALRVTRGLGTRLRQGTAGSGVRFGGVWTAVIVAQVAMTVAFPAIAYVQWRELARIRSADAGYAADEYLAVGLEMDPAAPGAEADTAGRRLRFARSLESLRARVAAEPGVVGVTFVNVLPRDEHEERRMELDDPRPQPRWVSVAHIDPSYYDVLGAPILAGRGFGAADLTPGARVAIVDRGFVDRMMQGRNPIGRRIRVVADSASDADAADASRPWLEIVGVVKELGMAGPITNGGVPGLYLPAAPGSAGKLQMLVHAPGDPMALALRVRSLAAAVDPALRPSTLQRADQVTNTLLWLGALWLRITVVLTAVALLLSLAGIYSVLSFTVARRTREIGVRVALGAGRRRVAAAMFRRPLTQVGAGVAVGSILAGVAARGMSAALSGSTISRALSSGGIAPREVALLVAYAALMLGVCLLACVVPTRRALRVEPVEALRAD
jgi:predicted permease